MGVGAPTPPESQREGSKDGGEGDEEEAKAGLVQDDDKDFDFADDDVMLNLVHEQGQLPNGGMERRDSAWVMAHQAGQAVSEWLQRKDRERARPASPPPPLQSPTTTLPDPLLDPAAALTSTSSAAATKTPLLTSSQRVKVRRSPQRP
jgi:hypothetical protein